VLHDPTYGGGLGFCQEALSGLLPPGYHGPLVVALDSNVLIDLQLYGAALMSDEPLPDSVAKDKAYAADLAGLVDLLNLWLLRDIRFVVTPRSRTDAKRVTKPEVLERRLASIDALALSLAFQTEDWSGQAPSDAPLPVAAGTETRLPVGADRELVLEAQAVGAHAFLTRDRQVLKRTALSGRQMTVTSPSRLTSDLVRGGVQPFFGGTCGGDGCPYGDWSLPAPDMGKWAGVLSVLE